MKKFIYLFVCLCFLACTACSNNDENNIEKTTAIPTTELDWDYGYAIEAPEVIEISSDWNLLLVNRDNYLPDSYIDSIELSYIFEDSEEKLDSRVVPYYQEMFNAAAAEGIYLTPCSGYRSYDLQKNNFEALISSYEDSGYSEKDATLKASEEILPPGTSEHNAGLAMDIVTAEEWFEDTEAFAWLQENAQDYGFILRYPKDKQDITKIIYEPWHWRFVGVETAKAIKRSGLCLEEYLGVA